jgi:hypothetical protein
MYQCEILSYAVIATVDSSHHPAAGIKHQKQSRRESGRVSHMQGIVSGIPIEVQQWLVRS